jgi:3-amino-5-hydroxybenzoic acid synthesis related protein
MMKLQKKGVLFDFDGVLINSLTTMRVSFEAAYQDYYGDSDVPECVDFELLFEEYRKHLGKGFPEIMQAMGLSVELMPLFVQHSRYLARYIRVYSGVSAMLAALTNEGWTLGIATGKDHARTCELLNQLKLQDFFSVVLGFDSVAAPKPAPDMVHTFQSRTGIPLEHLIMVGDAPSDLQCAKNAGCRSVAALWGYTAPEVLELETPDFTVESPAQLTLLLHDLAEALSQ